MIINGCYGQTHIGKVRRENEDAFLLDSWPDHGAVLAVIADGMGSYGGGAYAANAVTDTFAELLREPLPRTQFERYEMLYGAFYRADSRIRAMQQSLNPEMGATVIAVIATENEVLHLHAGDCRLYHFSGGRLDYVSRDHSVVQALVDSGDIKEDEALAHPMRSIVTSCLGGPSTNLRLTIEPTLQEGPFLKFASGDVVVLGSDGFWSEISAEVMLSIIQGNQLLNDGSQDLSQVLVDCALSGSAKDNITAIVLEANSFLGKNNW